MLRSSSTGSIRRSSRRSAGRILDRDAAGQAIVGALAAFGRGNAVPLPTKVDEPKVTGPMLARAAAQARLAVSAPVTLVGVKRLRVPRWKIALALELPKDGATKLRIGGPGADALFKSLQKQVNTKAHDAQFVVTSGGIRIQPSIDARVLDVPKTAEGLLAAALRTTNRSAPIVVASSQPKRTTADAQAMGITGLVSSYTTSYGGVPNRIHNVEVVSHLVDNTLIPPHKEFSFNGTTGERNAAKGLLEAPVIINGELENGLGGGTCQVSTTVFNAAYEAGLPITARTNHALYISHYPQGRDATVNYPDTDLKFVNDSDHWLLLRTFVSSSTLTVNLYGTPLHRRVESDVAPLRVTGPVPEKVTKDSDAARRQEGRRSPGLAAARDERHPARVRREGQAALSRRRSTRATSATSRSSARARSRSPSRSPSPCRSTRRASCRRTSCRRRVTTTLRPPADALDRRRRRRHATTP